MQNLKVQLCSERFVENTKNSSVLGISRIDLTPAQTTVTAVRPSSVKSEDTSMAAQPYTQILSSSAGFDTNPMKHMKLLIAFESLQRKHLLSVTKCNVPGLKLKF